VDGGSGTGVGCATAFAYVFLLFGCMGAVVLGSGAVVALFGQSFLRCPVSRQWMQLGGEPGHDTRMVCFIILRVGVRSLAKLYPDGADTTASHLDVTSLVSLMVIGWISSTIHHCSNALTRIGLIVAAALTGTFMSRIRVFSESFPLGGRMGIVFVSTSNSPWAIKVSASSSVSKKT